MFSFKSSEDDILQVMEDNLKKQASEEVCKNDNLKKETIENLNIAAEKCEEYGLDKYASLITKIAEYVADKNYVSKGLSSEKQVQNLIHHGTPLNLPSKIKMKAPAGKKDYNKDEDIIIVVDDDENKELNENELEEIGNIF
jgi:hypothetical protein